MAFTPITLTGTFTRPDGTPASGSVTARLSAPLQDAATNVIRPRVLLVDILDATGSVSFDLVATDSPGLVPYGATYLITEEITGSPPRLYSIVIPFGALDGTLDLADVAPGVDSPLYYYVLKATHDALDARVTNVETGLGTGGANLTAHASATTGVHGVGASTVESVAGAQAKSNTAQAAAETTAGTALTAHAAAVDPHAGYLSAAEGNVAYEPSGSTASHAVDTTAVHGIADTTALLDTADVGVSVQAHSPVLAATTASFLVADETRLDGIAAGATVNSTDAALRDRATHTGAQGIPTVTGLQAGLDSKAATTDARLSDTRTPTDGTVTTAKIGDGQVTAAKVAADVATQAELDDEAATRAAADTARLLLAGGTLTGPLVLAADGSAALHPVSKQQLDTATSAAVTLDTAQTVTGVKTFSAPVGTALVSVSPQPAAPYVDPAAPTGFSTPSANLGGVEIRQPNSNTTGVGTGALRSNTTGTSNLAFGTNALYANTTGNGNIAIGVGALRFNTTGLNNMALGGVALQNNTTGADNTAFAINALRNNTTGSGNTAVGGSALFSNTTANDNTAMGSNALRNNTIGVGNTAIGTSALHAPAGLSANTTTTGSRQTGFGAESGQASTTQRNDITVIGYRSLADADFAVAIGSGAQALHANSVALGAVTTAANQVHFGNRGLFSQPPASQVGQVIKAAASQTGDLQQWQNSAGTILADVSATGVGTFADLVSTLGVSMIKGDGVFAGRRTLVGGDVIRVGVVGDPGGTSNRYRVTADGTTVWGPSGNTGDVQISRSNIGELTVQGVGSAAATTFKLKGIASQTGDLQQWQNSAGTVLGRLNSSGAFTAQGLSHPNYDGPYMNMVFGNQFTISQSAGRPNSRVLVLQGAASQTGDLQQWQNSAGAVLAKVTADGVPTFTMTSLLRTLELGAVDSAGAGFRTVRVAN